MKKVFIALSLFTTISLATYAAPKKGKIDSDSRGKAMKELNLSANQESEIKSLNKEFSQKMETLRRDESLSREAKKEQSKELRKARQQKMQAILTPEQQTKWKEIRKDKRSHQRNHRMHNRGGNNKAMANLNLTDSQKEKIADINKNYRDRRKSLNDSRVKEINSVLTAEQQSILKENKKQFADNHRKGKRQHTKQQ